jgi:UDP-glucose 6-dehydrogenase
MRISVFGLGYVGGVSAACLASDGHEVVGVDVNEAVTAERLAATMSGREAIHRTALSFICVGTPSQKNGNLDLGYVERVCDEIGASLATKSGYHTVAMRSTVLPGAIREVVLSPLDRETSRIRSLRSPSLEDMVSKSDVLVVANESPSFYGLPQLLRDGRILIDLVGIDTHKESIGGSYEGVCW